MWILSHAFFADTFQPMNAAVAFQIGLKDSAWAIRGKFTFAGARESCWVIRTMYNNIAFSLTSETILPLANHITPTTFLASILNTNFEVNRLRIFLTE